MNLGLNLSLGIGIARATIIAWILRTGFWDDAAPWDDTQTWKDS